MDFVMLIIKVATFLVILSLVLGLSISGSFVSYGVNETSVKTDNAALQKLVPEYLNWKVNVPATDEPSKDSSQSNPCLIKRGPVNFLLDPYQREAINQTCTIDAGTSILFPFLVGWCDRGSSGNQAANFDLRACLSDSNKGAITMQALLDGSKIADLQVFNDGLGKSILIYNKLPQSAYYNHISVNTPFNFTVTKNLKIACTALTSNDKMTEKSCGPAIAECYCGIVSNLTSGTHKLRYHTTILGSTGSGDYKAEGVNEVNDDISYTFNVGK